MQHPFHKIDDGRKFLKVKLPYRMPRKRRIKWFGKHYPLALSIKQITATRFEVWTL